MFGGVGGKVGGARWPLVHRLRPRGGDGEDHVWVVGGGGGDGGGGGGWAGGGGGEGVECGSLCRLSFWREGRGGSKEWMNG